MNTALSSGDVTTGLGYTPVNKIGDTMTGLLVLSADPAANLGASTKQYVDSSTSAAAANYLRKDGTSVLSADWDADGIGAGTRKISGLADPTASDGAATKNYADTMLMTKTLPAVPALGQDGQVLRWNNTTGVWEFYTPSTGNGTVTSVSSANSYMSVATGTTTPALTLNVGTAANTLAAGDDSRITGALPAATAFAGDVSGVYSATSVDKIKGTGVAITTITSGNFLKYNGTNWVNSNLAAGDVTGALTYSPVNKAGDTMTGLLVLSADPSANLGASTKQYVDAVTTSSNSNFIRKDGTSVLSADWDADGAGGGTRKITGLTSPTDGDGAATKTYADTQFITKTLPAVPTVTQNGQSLRWNNGTNAWEYYTAGSGGGDFMASGAVPMTGTLKMGGNAVFGNTTASGNLILESTSDATKGFVNIQPNGGNVGIGTTSPSTLLDLNGAQTFRATTAPGAVAAQGKIYFDSTTNKFKVSENNGAFVDLVGGGGTVTSVSSANSYLSVATGTTTPALTLNVGTAANTVAAGDDSRITGALPAATAFAGDVSGVYSATSVDKIKGTGVSITTITSGNFLKYNGTNWVNSNLAAGDVTGALTYTPVNKAGDTMTGLLVLSADPAANLGASTKQYTDSSTSTASANYLRKDATVALTADWDADGAGAGTRKISGLADPTVSDGAATKNYSDTKFITKTLPAAPAVGQNGQSIRWNNGSNIWEYYTPGTGTGDFLADGTIPMTGTLKMGGQSIFGNSTANGNLILESTSNATKGTILLAPNGGNVVIGASTGTAKLEIEPSAGAETLKLWGNGSQNILQLWDHSDGQPLAYFDWIGNLTINNSVPRLNLNNDAGAGASAVAFSKSGTTLFTVGSDYTDDKFKIGTTNVGTNTRLTIDSTGKVGIGTTSPTAALQITGSNGSASSPDGTAGLIVSGGSGYLSGNGNGGAVSIAAGPSSGTGVAGALNLSAGASGGSSTTGGQTTISAGDGVVGGSLSLRSGNAWAGNGAATFTLGGSGTITTGGIVMSSGATGGSAGGNSGSISILTPSTTTGFTAEGGNINIAAGSGESAGSGGTVSISAGGGGASNINGSNVVLNGGQKGGSGLDGNVLLASTRGNVGIGTTVPVTALDVTGAATFRATAAPAAALAQGKLYYDTATNKFKVSENNGAFVDLIGGGGTVTSVSSANSYLSVATGTTTPSLTLNVGTAANTVAAGNDSRITGALPAATAFAGDVSGVYSATSVDKIKGTGVAITTITSGNFLKYNGTNWINSMLSASDVTNALTYTPVNKAGDTMTGLLVLSADPGANLGASTKQYVDAVTTSSASNFIRKDGTSVLSADWDIDGAGAGTRKIAGLADPTAADGAATKNYADTKFITRTLPAVPAVGQNGQSIRWNNAGAAWEYYTPATSVDTLLNGGNSFGAVASVGTNDAQQFNIETNNVARIRVGSTGNVGIGINPNANYKLDILGPATAAWTNYEVLAIRDPSWGGGLVFGYTADGTNSSLATADIGTNGQDLAFFASYGKGMTLQKTTLNVGIGTATPAHKLHVNGNALVGSNQLTNITPAPLNMVNSAANALKTQLNIVNSGGGAGAGSAVDFYTYDGAPADVVNPGLRMGVLDNNWSADFVISSKTPGLGSNPLNERFRITNVGDVGVGTATPNAKIQINGTTNTTTVYSNLMQNWSVPVIPSVKNTNSGGIAIGSFETGVDGRSRMDFKLAGLPLAGNDWGNIPDVTVMTLNANGNVGIGTNAPTAALHVVGSVRMVDGNQGAGRLLAGDANGTGSWAIFPKFRARSSATQTLPSATWTKLTLDMKDFDNTSAFDALTNYRFQPTVAGQYQIVGSTSTPACGSNSALILAIYKNGVLTVSKTEGVFAGNGSSFQVQDLVDMNGTTDYVELYGLTYCVAMTYLSNLTGFRIP